MTHVVSVIPVIRVIRVTPAFLWTLVICIILWTVPPLASFLFLAVMGNSLDLAVVDLAVVDLAVQAGQHLRAVHTMRRTSVMTPVHARMTRWEGASIRVRPAIDRWFPKVAAMKRGSTAAMTQVLITLLMRIKTVIALPSEVAVVRVSTMYSQFLRGRTSPVPSPSICLLLEGECACISSWISGAPG